MKYSQISDSALVLTLMNLTQFYKGRVLSNKTKTPEWIYYLSVVVALMVSRNLWGIVGLSILPTPRPHAHAALYLPVEGNFISKFLVVNIAVEEVVADVSGGSFHTFDKDFSFGHIKVVVQELPRVFGPPKEVLGNSAPKF